MPIIGLYLSHASEKYVCFQFAFEELVSICDNNGSSEEVLNIPTKYLSSKRGRRIMGSYYSNADTKGNRSSRKGAVIFGKIKTKASLFSHMTVV